MSLVQREKVLEIWNNACKRMNYAFQPVVNTYTGRVFGYEALLRRFEPEGFAAIHQVFDRAAEDGVLEEVNRFLFCRAASLFLESCAPGTRLLFNIDNRLFDERFSETVLPGIISAGGLAAERIVLEISERDPLPENAYRPEQLPSLRTRGIHVALDDFGAGYSGLQVLYQAQVDIIKMDRFFVSGIAEDAPKRIFVTNLVKLAHTMGMSVVAEGVETTADFYTCREIGCDYLQGYLISRPQLPADDEEFPVHYPIISELIEGDRRNDREDQKQIEYRMNVLETLDVDTSMGDVLRRFRSETETSYLPVVNRIGEPLGIIREHDLKEYVYSPYGISLLMNRSYRSDLASFVRKVPVAAIHHRLDRILELYSMDPGAEAIILTKGGTYLGCLDSRSLLQILHRREVATARDQNPLTRLPGNTIINEYLSAAFRPAFSWHSLVYLDFNNFKPFNDRYGFRVGDRVIQLFADSLKMMANSQEVFAGHIGGDDFFLLFEIDRDGIGQMFTDIRRLVRRFAQDVRAFYPPEAIETGYIEGRDRQGEWRRFPLLDISVAVLLVPPHEYYLNGEALSREIALLKKTAKKAPGSLVIASINPDRLHHVGST